MSALFGTPQGPQEIADRMAITDVLAAHSRALDRLDLELLQSCYWDDAQVDYGSYKGPAQQFAELVLPALDAQYELTRHCLCNTLIELRGAQALAESSVNAGHLLAGAKQEMLFGGRYLDTLEQRDGKWKLLHRQVVIDWSRQHPVEDERDGEAFSQLARGAHRDADPLHAFLQVRR